MYLQISTSYGSQALTSASVRNVLFTAFIFDDATIWDDEKIWVESAGVEIYGRLQHL